MPAKLGRRVTFLWNAAAVLGVREKGLTVNGEPVDITSDENSGWRTLLDEPGEMTVDIKISGVTKDERFLTDLFAGNVQRTASLTWFSGAVLTGTFQLVNRSETQPYKDAMSFEASLQSSGAITYTPGP